MSANRLNILRGGFLLAAFGNHIVLLFHYYLITVIIVLRYIRVSIFSTLVIRFVHMAESAIFRRQGEVYVLLWNIASAVRVYATALLAPSSADWPLCDISPDTKRCRKINNFHDV